MLHLQSLAKDVAGKVRQANWRSLNKVINFQYNVTSLLNMLVETLYTSDSSITHVCNNKGYVHKTVIKVIFSPID